MPDITSFIVIFIFCALQYFISRLKWGILGIIIPIIYVVAMFYAHSIGKINNTTVFVVLLVAGVIILIIEWVNARKDRAKKHSDELDKMRKKDL
ncbi:hypothetical protein WL278_11205 [Staphylococcus caprae]|uniref:hypothetical protein n=1 Tax=Staphylococcus TaxID=1279 RepID=UPI0008A9C4DC|nr:hypothetical protein [Staphylococcus sp. HMSC62A08]OHS38919.1 hypothetical protein HMPREF3264_05235 [Staphylococcus sp. HMSC62A08]